MNPRVKTSHLVIFIRIEHRLDRETCEVVRPSLLLVSSVKPSTGRDPVARRGVTYFESKGTGTGRSGTSPLPGSDSAHVYLLLPVSSDTQKRLRSRGEVVLSRRRRTGSFKEERQTPSFGVKYTLFYKETDQTRRETHKRISWSVTHSPVPLVLNTETL